MLYNTVSCWGWDSRTKGELTPYITRGVVTEQRCSSRETAVWCACDSLELMLVKHCSMADSIFCFFLGMYRIQDSVLDSALLTGFAFFFGDRSRNRCVVFDLAKSLAVDSLFGRSRTFK